MSYWSDLAAVLKGDFLALDETEAALIGAPAGETISLYAEMESRHGVLLARFACLVFSVLIQRGHCQAQLDGTPMKPMNYFRAAVGLVLAALVAMAIVVFALKGGWIVFERALKVLS